MSVPIVSIVGPTATGKTSLALSLSEKLLSANTVTGIDLISADSRQVYRGLETLTGADIPADFILEESPDFTYPFFEQDSIKLHGVSIIKPDEEWSMAHFRTMAQEIILHSLKEKRLPIVVGGTGLFHRHLLSTDPRVKVAPNPAVRKKAAVMPLSELQQWAATIQPNRFTSLNNSDRNNPRRLIRIIEIGQAKQAGKFTTDESLEVDHLQEKQHLFIGLKLEKDQLATQISDRVIERMEAGADAEVEQIYNRFSEKEVSLSKKKTPAFSSLGFSELLAYVQGEITQEESLEVWTKKEISYAKRQMTWFKKNEEIHWFAADLKNLEGEVYLLLEKSL